MNAARRPQHTEPGLDRSEQAEAGDGAVATGKTPRESELQAELARSKQQLARSEQQLKLTRRSTLWGLLFEGVVSTQRFFSR